MKAKRRWHLFSAAIGIVTLTCYLLLTGSCAYFKDWRYLPTDIQDEHTVYVVNHGWHTGVVIAREQLGERLAFVPQYLGTSAYYEFGWGDKTYYQASDESVSLALHAAFRSQGATMHVVAVPTSPEGYFPASTVVPLKISTTAARLLSNAIADSFAGNAIRPTGQGLYGTSAFFDATGHFYLGRTCNTWTATVLATAGVPMTRFTWTGDSAIRQAAWAARKYRRRAQEQPIA